MCIYCPLGFDRRTCSLRLLPSVCPTRLSSSIQLGSKIEDVRLNPPLKSSTKNPVLDLTSPLELSSTRLTASCSRKERETVSSRVLDTILQLGNVLHSESLVTMSECGEVFDVQSVATILHCVEKQFTNFLLGWLWLQCFCATVDTNLCSEVFGVVSDDHMIHSTIVVINSVGRCCLRPWALRIDQ